MEININGQLVPVQLVTAYNSEGREFIRVLLYVPYQDAYVTAELTAESIKTLALLVPVIDSNLQQPGN